MVSATLFATAVLMLAATIPAGATDSESERLLSQMVDDLRRDLDLTDAQTAAVRELAEEAGEQADAVIDEFDRYTLDSSIDLLKAEREISKQFHKDVSEVLTPEQRQTFDTMSTLEELEKQFIVALLSEKRVKKIRLRAGLRDDQVPEVSDIVTREMADSVDAVYDIDPKSELAGVDVLNAIDGVRDAHRRSNHELEQTLEPEQWARLEEIRRQKKPHLPKKWRPQKKKRSQQR